MLTNKCKHIVHNGLVVGVLVREAPTLLHMLWLPLFEVRLA